MATKITKNFSLEEFTKSCTADRKGIDNTPSHEVKNNIARLVKEIMQPIRDKYKKPIVINSGYRCDALNKAVGGSRTSQHCTGEAVDFETTNGVNDKLFRLVKEMVEKGEIQCGQLIWEYGSKKNPNWIHISLPRRNKPNNQILYFYN